MEELKKNKKIVLLVVGVLAFIFAAFCPAIDVLGKDTMSGFKYVFDATGAGFTRFLYLIFFLLPLAGGVYAYVVPEIKWGKNMLYIFGGAAILGLITLLGLPTGLSFAFGAWLGFVLCLVGAVLAVMFKAPANK